LPTDNVIRSFRGLLQPPKYFQIQGLLPTDNVIRSFRGLLQPPKYFQIQGLLPTDNVIRPLPKSANQALHSKTD
jgi:hypothetical protein